MSLWPLLVLFSVRLLMAMAIATASGQSLPMGSVVVPP